MSNNKLKLKSDKTEFIVVGAKDRYKWLSNSFPVNTLGNCLSPTDLFDAKFCFTYHINSLIISCFISLRDLHHIRFLSVDTSVVIKNALVSSRIIAILYFIVCHPVILPGSNMFKTLLHGLSPVFSLAPHPA